MRICDVVPGMRLCDPFTTDSRLKFITVTALTERGFKYSHDTAVCVHPRLGITFAQEGHETFAINGCVRYELPPVGEADRNGSECTGLDTALN